MSDVKTGDAVWVRGKVKCFFCKGRGHTFWLKRTCKVCFGKGEV